MIALLIVADQYDLNSFTREIYAFPDKQNGIVPVVGVDGWSRIINQHPQFDGMEFRASDTIVEMPSSKPCPEWMECVMHRKDRKHPTSICEYLDEVYREPFTGNKDGRSYTVNGPWQSHTKRFLRHKAMIQAARLVFGFGGIFDPDEAQRIVEGQSDPLSTGTGLTPVVTGSEASHDARRMATKLIARAEKAGAWQSAIDYASERFKGADLAYVKAEINRAKLERQPALTAEPQPVNPQQAQTTEPAQTQA